MAPENLLQLLQSRTTVDCDTMSFEVAKSLGPFVDCTSNQIIAFGELSKLENAKIVQESIETAKKLATKYPEVSFPELAVEVAMVKLQLAISEVITGCVHVQTNPYHSYETEKMVADAKRIIAIFAHLSPSFDTKRICLKIPSSWEGMQSCRILQSSSPPITTLATTLFNMEQATLAGEAGCTYIAPYVNELRVHFEPGMVDQNKAFGLCVQAQKYFKKHGQETKVLPASLTSVSEIMALVGVDHITISPGLLEQLIATKAGGCEFKSLFDGESAEATALIKWGGDEKGWRMAFTRSGNGQGERKLSEAINLFCDAQTNLEAMMV